VETQDENSQDALCAEILAEARRESEQLVGRARNEAGALLARTEAEAERVRQERLAQAGTEAARRKELILATVPVEAGRERLEAIEALLQTICEQARLQLAARRGFNYRATIIDLASEAISRMAGDTFVVKLLAADRIALGDGLAEAITTRLGRSPLSITISDDPAIADGGVMVQDAQGRQAWDNRLPARLKRLWPELRRQIAIRTSLVVENSMPGGRL
jgi:V/A-type H+/Na+-transporting ATPase subunit E